MLNRFDSFYEKPIYKDSLLYFFNSFEMFISHLSLYSFGSVIYGRDLSIFTFLKNVNIIY